MKKTIAFFVAIILLYAVLYWIRLEYVLTLDNVNVMYADFINGNASTADNIFNHAHSHWVLGSLFAVLSSASRLFFWAFVVYCGFYLLQKQNFWQILKVVILTESVNVLMNIVKTANLVFFNRPTSPAALTTSPLSLASLFDIDKLDPWMVIPLSAANLFEVAYIVMLSFLLSRNLKLSLATTSKVVLCSYGLVSLLITVVSTFITVYSTK